MIEETVKKIRDGSNSVAKTNEAFAKVASGAKKVGELIGEISEATDEQDQGANQINKAVAEMDKVVQGNAAGAEESASMAEEMNTQAGLLKKFVGELVVIMGGKRIGHGPITGNDPGLVEVRRSDGAVGYRPKEKTKSIRKAVLQNPKEVKPDQRIPMDEEDFKEF